MKYAAPLMKIAILGRYKPSRTYYLHHAQELVVWAQEIEDDDKPIKNVSKGILNAVGDARECFTCDKPNHIARECRSRSLSQWCGRQKDSLGACSVSVTVEIDQRIVDSGTSRHLVRNVSILKNAKDCKESNWFLLLNGKRLQATEKAQ